jgi:hypothetical protein
MHDERKIIIKLLDSDDKLLIPVAWNGGKTQVLPLISPHASGQLLLAV